MTRTTAPKGYYIVQFRKRHERSWTSTAKEYASVEWADAAATEHWQANHFHTRVLFLIPVASHKPAVVMELKCA